MPEVDLPPEPGTVSDLDHGVPGDAEPLPDDDVEVGDSEPAEVED